MEILAGVTSLLVQMKDSKQFLCKGKHSTFLVWGLCSLIFVWKPEEKQGEGSTIFSPQWQSYFKIIKTHHVIWKSLKEKFFFISAGWWCELQDRAHLNWLVLVTTGFLLKGKEPPNSLICGFHQAARWTQKPRSKKTLALSPSSASGAIFLLTAGNWHFISVEKQAEATEATCSRFQGWQAADPRPDSKPSHRPGLPSVASFSTLGCHWVSLFCRQVTCCWVTWSREASFGSRRMVTAGPLEDLVHTRWCPQGQPLVHGDTPGSGNLISGVHLL